MTTPKDVQIVYEILCDTDWPDDWNKGGMTPELFQAQRVVEALQAMLDVTDRDLCPSRRSIGNMWEKYYLVAHHELVIANRAVQRLSQQCKNLRFILHNLTVSLGRNERERFEHWAEYSGLDLEKDEKFQYVFATTYQAWECWQARARLDGAQIESPHAPF